MTEFTHQDIPISCGECSTYVLGQDAMVRHILDFHMTYNPDEAVQYAEKWMWDAFDRVEEEALDYAHAQSLKTKGKYYVA